MAVGGNLSVPCGGEVKWLGDSAVPTGRKEVKLATPSSVLPPLAKAGFVIALLRTEQGWIYLLYVLLLFAFFCIIIHRL